ncbi:MAG: carboxymuconolactone decarboxylase family protein [Rhodospirillaceae bacterium]
MTQFVFHTPETAPAAAAARLDKAQKTMGFIPNLWAAMADAPQLLEGYQTIAALFDKTSFSVTERQVVLITANFEHECTYCMAAHSRMSLAQGVSQEVVDALRDDTPLPEPKLEALRTFTRAVIAARGWVDDADTKAFLAAGYETKHVLEVILGLSLKVMSNYTNHFAETPLNKEITDYAWSKPLPQAAE